MGSFTINQAGGFGAAEIPILQVVWVYILIEMFPLETGYNTKISLSSSQILENYEKRKVTALFDLRIKQIFLATLVLLNLAALAFVYRELVFYYPYTSQPFVASAFVFGVIGALVSMKIHTCGITEDNIDQFVNPLALLGRVLSYLLFAPVLIATKFLDMTNYADPEKVGEIAVHIATSDFAFVMKTYGPNIQNLEKYGLIQASEACDFQKIYNKYVSVFPLKCHYEKIMKNGKPESLESKKKIKIVEKSKQVDADWKNLEKRWANLKKDIQLPDPEPTSPDFSKRSVRYTYQAKEIFMNCARTGSL